MPTALLGLLVLIAHGPPARAAPVDPMAAGAAASAQGDWSTALRDLRPLANAGNPLAQTAVGYIFAYGEGVAKDPVEAWMWLDLAVERLPRSQDKLRDEAIKTRDELEADMTFSQKLEARRRRELWVAR